MSGWDLSGLTLVCEVSMRVSGSYLEFGLLFIYDSFYNAFNSLGM
jgi:hypothetical protein